MECPHCGHENKDSDIAVCWVESDSPSYFEVDCFECEKPFQVYAEASVDFYLVEEEEKPSLLDCLGISGEGRKESVQSVREIRDEWDET